MQRFLIICSCLLAIFSAKATEWGVVGEFNGWNVENYTVMTDNQDGTYSVTIPSLQGEFKFAADRGWNTNLGAAQQSIVTGDGVLPVSPNSPNFNAPQPLVNVTIVLDPANNKVTFSGLSEGESHEWGVVGAFNNWNVDNYSVMTKNTNGTFSVTIPSLQGDFKLAADRSWEINIGGRRAYDITGNAQVYASYGGVNFTASDELKNVTIVLDVTNLTVTFSGLPNDMDANAPLIKTGHFLMGEGFGGWSPDCGTPMTQTQDGVYTWEGTMEENQHFGITTALISSDDIGAAWNYINEHRYGPAEQTDSEDLIIGTTIALKYPVADAAWRITEKGRYTLILDTNKMTFTAEKAPEYWGVVGDFNQWGANNSDAIMEQINDTEWTITLNNIGGSNFKFRYGYSWDTQIGAASLNEAITAEDVKNMRTYVCTINGDIFHVDSDIETLTIILDTENLTMKISGKSGITDISTDTSASVYYNLQGIKVNTPEKGLYIRVQDNKVEKIVLP